MDLLEEHGITDVLINLHHLPDQVEAFAGAYSGSVRIHTVMESELLGSAGTLDANRSFVEGEDAYFILYADNLTNVDLSALMRRHRERSAVLTMGLFHAENPSACGIAALDDDGVIVRFEEKPAEPQSDLANAGMYVGGPELFQYVCPLSFPWDFGMHVIPKLVGRMNGLLLDGYIRDVGTHDNLHRAEREWRALHPELRT
jgi:mannose-1-phosphate guanylyltransferase